MKRNEIGSCLFQNTVEDIYDCIEYFKKLPQCKRLTKLQVNLKKLSKLLRRKIAFLENGNDFYQGNYDTDSDYDDDDEDFYEGDHDENDNEDSLDRVYKLLSTPKWRQLVAAEDRAEDEFYSRVLALDQAKVSFNKAMEDSLNNYDKQGKELHEADEKGDLQEDYGTEKRDNVNSYEDTTNCGDANEEQDVANENSYDDPANGDGVQVDYENETGDNADLFLGSMIAVPKVCSTEYQSECETMQEENIVEDNVVECSEEVERKCKDMTTGFTSSQKCSDWPVQKCDVQKKKVKNALQYKIEASFELREDVLIIQERVHACQHDPGVQCRDGVVTQQAAYWCHQVWDPGGIVCW